jgi:hypothetical protein
MLNMSYEAVPVDHRRFTGEEAGMEEEDIENKMFSTLARNFMSASLLRKHPGHIFKPTDYHMWKQYPVYTTKKGARNRIFRCPMRHRCGCKTRIRIAEAPG